MEPLNKDSVNLNTQFFNFLGKPSNRYLYNKTVSWIKKFQNINVNVEFLKECLAENVIPRSFKITNQPKSKNQNLKWTTASKTTSIEWMKLAIEEDLKQKISHKENYQRIFKEIQNLTPENLKPILTSKIDHKSKMFYREFK